MTILSFETLSEFLTLGAIKTFLAIEIKSNFLQISIRDILNFIAAGVTILGAVLGMVFWYGRLERRRYGSERDLNHLKNNQLDLSRNILEMKDDADRKMDVIEKHIIEIKALLLSKHQN